MSRTAATEHEKKAFMTIVNGKWAEKVEKGTTGSIERVNKKGDTVHEMQYSDVTGVVKDLKIEKKDFGKQLNVLIDDVGETYTLSIPVESRYFDAFCSKIGNADMSKPMTITPYSFTPNGEKSVKTGINIYQIGNPKALKADGTIDVKGKLPFYFTKENPHGRPLPQKDGRPLADGETLEEEEWKAYFLIISMFNQKYIEKFMQPVADEKPVRQAPKSTEATMVDGAAPLPF